MPTETLTTREVECPFCSSKKIPRLVPLDDNGLMVVCTTCKWTAMTVGGLCHQLNLNVCDIDQAEKKKINDMILQIASFTGKSFKFKNDPYLTSVLLLQGEIGAGYRRPPRIFTVKYNPLWSKLCSPKLLLAMILHHLVHIKVSIDRGYECYMVGKQLFAGKEEELQFFTDKSHYFLRLIEHLWVWREMQTMCPTLAAELNSWLLKVTEKGIKAETHDTVLLKWWGYLLVNSKDSDASPDAFIQCQIDFYGIYQDRMTRRRKLEFGLEFADIKLHRPQIFEEIVSRYQNADGFGEVFSIAQRIAEGIGGYSRFSITAYKGAVEKAIEVLGLDRCMAVERCNTEELYR